VLNFFLGIICGIVIATVGIQGVIDFLNKGIDAVKQTSVELSSQ
jgi:hypothetical protein